MAVPGSGRSLNLGRLLGERGASLETLETYGHTRQRLREAGERYPPPRIIRSGLVGEIFGEIVANRVDEFTSPPVVWRR